LLHGSYIPQSFGLTDSQRGNKTIYILQSLFFFLLLTRIADLRSGREGNLRYFSDFDAAEEANL